MSTFEPNKYHLREALFFCFNLKKRAADGHQMLCETCGEHAPLIKTCEYWFRRFKSGDYDIKDKGREGKPVKFEDDELEELLDQDLCQTQEELAETLEVTQQAISSHLKTMGMVQKPGNWARYDLKPRNVEQSLFTCEQLLQRQNWKGFCIES